MNLPETLWDWLLILVVAAVLLLSGCAAAPPKVPDVVQVPIPVACLKPGDIPPPPAVLPDGHLAKLDAYDLVRTIAAERAELIAWSLQAAAALARCSQAPSVDNLRLNAL